MKYSDIAKALTGTLKELFPDRRIYSIMRVEDMKRPAFFFSIKPVIDEPSNRRTRHNILSVYIDYFQEVKDEADLYDTANTIRDALGWSYPVGDDYINVTEFDWDFVGSERNIIEMNITLEYFDAIDNDEHAELIEDVDITYYLREVYK